MPATATRPTANTRLAATPRTAAKEITDQNEVFKEDVETVLDLLTTGAADHVTTYLRALAEERANGRRVHGAFKNWSLRNRAMLAAQVSRRGANVKTLFAGTAQWAKMDREVLADEVDRPYFIYGSPVIMRRRDDNDQNQDQDQAQNQGQGGNRIAGFRRPPLLKVYDWTQTRSTDPSYIEPDWSVPLAAGDNTTLEQMVTSSPVPVHFADLAARSENGWLDTDGIHIDASMPIGNQISTLAHELGHHHGGHLEQLNSAATTTGDLEYSPRAVAEQEACLVQWLVMRELGLGAEVGNDIDTALAEYLHSWTKINAAGEVIELAGKKGRRKLIETRLNTAAKLADTIVTAYLDAAGAE